MGVKEIIEKIQQEGQAEIQKIKDYTAARILEIKKDQENERKIFYDAELERIQKEAFELKAGIILSAKLEQRKAILKAKRSQIQAVLNLVQAEFKTYLGPEKYLKLLTGLIQQHAEEGDTVILSKEDLQEFGASLTQTASKKINLKSGNLKAGLILEKSKINYNFSVSSILEQQSESLEKVIGQNLHVL